ncbi:MAG: ACT domain-containing protein, partial [Bryobacteraceae bacterium]
IVKTPRARNKIRHVINASERAKAIDLGEKYLEREARRVGVQLGRIDKADLERVAADYGVSKMEDLYAALGYGKYSPRQVLEKLAPEHPAEPEPAKLPPPTRPEPKDLVIKVSGMDDLLIYRAKCCNPIRGQSIVGFVTRGKGVAVHSVNCTNVQSLMYDPERKIDVEWAGGTEEIFAVKVAIQTDDRPGMLHNLTSLLVNEKSNIRSLEARSDEKRNGDGAIVDMTIEIKDQRQLSHILTGIRRISGVRDVQRIG